MRIGAFEISEPLPEFKEPHVLVNLRPWIDVGSVGTLTLSGLETRLGAQEIGKLARPGNFYDFTRYRPMTYYVEGERQVSLPNTTISYARKETGHDFLFFHLLEPNLHGEDFTDSILLLLKQFGVKRYCSLGSMYDMVPHTRPLLVTGGGVGEGAEVVRKKLGLSPSRYEGPTSITFLVSQGAVSMGIETVSLMVHLPQYAEVNEDYAGVVRIMETLRLLYDFPVDEADISKAEQQKRDIDAAVGRNAQLKGIIAQLEAHYDKQRAKKEEEEMPRLSPEIEKFLGEMDRRFRQG
ncbi:MAG: PAC2 family protein [Chloroflexota bacterium]